MSEPLRAHDPAASSPPGVPGRDGVSGGASPGDPARRAREHAEAEAAVNAVMRREVEKAAGRKAREREHWKPKAPPPRVTLLLTLLGFSLYLWFGHPQWLILSLPAMPTADYFAATTEIAAVLQRQRIDELRNEKGRPPATARQAGRPVRGVTPAPVRRKAHQLAAGSGWRPVVPDSLVVQMGRALTRMGLVRGGKPVVFHSPDSLTVLTGRTLIQVGLVVGGVR